MTVKDLQSLISPNITNEELEKMVKKDSNLTNVSLHNIRIKPPSQKIGDSYLSKIIRFTINAEGIDNSGERKQVSVNVITKIVPKNVGRRKTFRSKDFFENEIIFYDKVWPALKKFYESKNLTGVFGGIIPNFLAHHLGEDDGYICLEDLSYKNYTSIERGDGIDYFHTVTVMDAYAKFHSLSFAFKDQCGQQSEEIFNTLKETYFSEKFYPWYKNMHQNLLDVVRDAVRNELPEEYYNKIDDVFKDDLFKRTCEMCENNHSSLSGINQGDCWIPNFLFKDSHATLLDFQLARWAPFSNDVMYFLLTCVNVDILRKHWDEIVKEYVTKVKHYLTLLGTSPDLFSIQELERDIKKNIAGPIAMLIEALPMSLVEGFDVDLIEGDEAVPLESMWAVRPFKDEASRRRIADVIKFIIEKNWI